MSVLDLLQGLAEPWGFLLLSARYIPQTLGQLLRAGDWGAFLSWDKFSYVWFANFWSVAGPLVRAGAEARVVPLLQGRVRSGAVVPAQDAVSPGVGGTVIEVGPGSGNWVSIFSDKYVDSMYLNGTDKGDTGDKGSSGKDGDKDVPGMRRRVSRAYGIEPNPDHYAALRQRIADAGLEGRYEVVPVGIEDIAHTTTLSGLVLEKESVDAIVTILCLCSIPDPAKNIRELYSYLKPGGRWYVYEHVRTRPSQGLFIGLYQKFLNIFWPKCLGGCQLCRDTETPLRAAGKWASVDLAMCVDEPWWHTRPHLYGILTKAA